MKGAIEKKLSSAFLRKWWFVVAVSVGIILFGIVLAVFFLSWVNLVIDQQIILKKGSRTFDLWAKFPVHPVLSVFVYNVTNADEFLYNGSKPIVDEIGPYVYIETWEKKNLALHPNGTITFNQEKIYHFDKSRSFGSDDDVVVVPNIPMLSATSQSKHAEEFLRSAMVIIMDQLEVKPFVSVSVGQLLWGYEDSLMKLAKTGVPNGQKPPYGGYGLMDDKNGTSMDNVTLYTGSSDITKFGLIDNVNGISKLTHWTTDECNSMMGSDGSIFPPHVTSNTTLYLYNRDFCRLLPLKFVKELLSTNDVPAYRFAPARNVFGTPEENPENECYCPQGPPCTPSGFVNISLCQYDTPFFVSFPHFYLANDSYRTAFEGISPPDPEKHSFYLDVQPLMGVTLSAKLRMQINLVVSQVVDIKQVSTFPDIVFPILWFEEGNDGLPEGVTNTMRLASTVPPIARTALAAVLIAVGAFLLFIAAWRLVRGANRPSSLQLATSHVSTPVPTEEIPMRNVSNNARALDET